MRQFDWVQIQTKKEQHLRVLQGMVAEEIERQAPFSEPAIRISLAMIRKKFGTDAEMQTRQQFNLVNQVAA